MALVYLLEAREQGLLEGHLVKALVLSRRKRLQQRQAEHQERSDNYEYEHYCI